MENQDKKEKSERALKEEAVLKFWQDNKIFEKSLEKKSPKGEFVFYDGPPFATGLPHAGSLLSSVTKDAIPRYKTMQGYHVRRRWGWDCHGLPIENMIEKELGIKDKTEIEGKVGIKAFNEACRSSVLRYAHEWKKYVDRVGRWVEYDNAYKTMDNSYIESVWHALGEINKKGLLYEGRKVLLYCPHCQTPIAKAEIAMDNSYKDVTEESVYVKFKIVGFPNAYFLAWTTTPWTLPGNVALAVGADMDYVEVKVGEEILVLAKERLSIISEPYKIVAEHKGREMVGMEYEPLFNISAVRDSGKKAYYVTTADFVTTEDGTGIVHTAVIYGEDDYNLGLKIDLPMVPLLDQAGHFNNLAPELVQGQYFKKAEKAIKEDLESRNLLFKKENYTHSYPHCHRCGTALLYNAISSWFINIQKVKDKMIKLNEKVNWIPSHLKHGRFLNIVENAPDWTISRNRYWAAPLPIWKDEAGKITLVSSLEDLRGAIKTNKNRFMGMRHGQAEHNVLNVCSSDPDYPHHLTEEGKSKVEDSAKKLKKEGITKIIISPFLRTKETASIVAEVLGYPQDEIIVDERLREYEYGNFQLKDREEYLNWRRAHNNFFTSTEGGESLFDSRKRFAEFLYDTEKKYSNETILFISHGIAFETIPSIMRGDSAEVAWREWKEEPVTYGEFVKFDFVPLPHNDNFELDLHRPYIDEVELVSKDGGLLKRIPEVIDGWVESASMPFAEYHYPFENKKEFEKSFPGDFVAEYIAQTRTWFYYMHAIATMLFGDVAFKNVISTGNILAKDGSKMSKSKGNYTDPLILIDRVGADAFRYYMLSSVVMQSEDLAFKDEEVKEVHNRLINILANSLTFYELYADENIFASAKSSHVLDRWVISRLHQLVEEVTEAMDAYDLVRATRPLRDFVSDLSTWYIRRSRERFKGEDLEDKNSALATTRYVFQELSKLLAPTMPFIAEEIYQKTKSQKDASSVHLASWPEGGKVEDKVLVLMQETRKLVSLALESRMKANIKVRQPLSKLKVKSLKLESDYREIIKDEINVKEVLEDEKIELEIELDVTLTPELKEEGRVRDAIRAVQEWRKEQDLKPGEKAQYQVPEPEREFFSKHAGEIKKATNIEF